MRGIWRRIRTLVRWRRLESDLDEEISFHLSEDTEEHIAGGMDPHEASLAARRGFGNVTRVRAEARDVWAQPWLRDIGQDLRFASRLLVKERSFTAAAVIALALGIGANTTAFTLVNGALFGRLPFPESERIVELLSETPRGPVSRVSHPDFEDVRTITSTLSGVAAMLEAPVNVSDTESAAERMEGTYVSANLFGILRAAPALGRDFSADDDRPGADPVAILSHHVWQNRYAGDPEIVGRTVRANSGAVTIIGVMAPGMRFPIDTDLWLPQAQLQADDLREARDRRFFNTVGRLADGVSIDGSQTEIRAIGDRLAEAHPDTNTGYSLGLKPYLEPDRGSAMMLLSIQASVGLVLLIACANVANLLLARAAQRAREMSVRTSLGASRWRVVRQLLVESLVLAGLAGFAGLGLALAGVQWLEAMTRSFGLPFWMEMSIDRVELAFIAGVCVATTLLFGLAPALHVAKTDFNAGLKEGGRGFAGERRAGRWVRTLVIAELALTLVVLAGAGLMTRSFLALYRADHGLDTSRLLTMQIYLPPARYAELPQRVDLFRRLEERLHSISVIEAGALATEAPLGGGSDYLLAVEGSEPVPREQASIVSAVGVGDRYFETLGLGLRRGRTFGPVDGTPGQQTAIVNQRFATTHFPDQNPLGKRIRLEPHSNSPKGSGGASPEWTTIVGVAPDIPLYFDESVAATQSPMVYLPHRTEAQRFALLMLRTRDDPAKVTALLRDLMREIEPDLPLYNIQTMDERLARNWDEYELFGALFGAFGVIALVLSAVGVYAVTAYSVSQRLPEIGVRMALGAQPGQVRWLVLRSVLVQLAMGLGIGLTGALGLGKLLEGMLVGTHPTDLETLVPVALLLVAVAVFACLGPARRAASVAPVIALRSD